MVVVLAPKSHLKLVIVIEVLGNMKCAGTNIVLLVKIEGSVWYTIYNHLPIVKRVC